MNLNKLKMLNLRGFKVPQEGITAVKLGVDSGGSDI